MNTTTRDINDPAHRHAVLFPVDAGHFRETMSKFATGVAVVTSIHDGQPFGMTVNSLTSVSLAPCLLLICPRKGSATGEAIRKSGFFAVNVLDASQEDLCMRFVGEEADRFDGLDLPQDSHGLPVIPDSLAQISCRLYDIHPGGDHEIILGEIIQCQCATGTPLIYHGGQFFKGTA
ncbi:flavin reductase family protein [Alkalilacustris brevis]|uniref:flavin reductase family protein n=1 Tax=Alkalilacustris brevis TaxID=2026338 RepID=UPI000E0D6EEE|nr:flavin reductase family protein [Alkalilacustris brevis]